MLYPFVASLRSVRMAPYLVPNAYFIPNPSRVDGVGGAGWSHFRHWWGAISRWTANGVAPRPCSWPSKEACPNCRMLGRVAWTTTASLKRGSPSTFGRPQFSLQHSKSTRHAARPPVDCGFPVAAAAATIAVAHSRIHPLSVVCPRIVFIYDGHRLRCRINIPIVSVSRSSLVSV